MVVLICPGGDTTANDWFNVRIAVKEEVGASCEG